MAETTALAPREAVELTVAQQEAIRAARQQVRFIEELLQSVLQPGVDYGRVPGSERPCLYQPGAQILAIMTKVVPHFEVQSVREAEPDFIAHTVVTKLIHRETGEVVGHGVGSANSWERRYTSGKLEHVPRYDLDNTLLKMAKKRSFVDAVLTYTGASRIFTQDLEDLPELAGDDTAAGARGRRPAPKNPDAPSTEPQRKRILATLRELGIPKEDARAQIQARYGATKLVDLTVGQASDYIGHLEGLKREAARAAAGGEAPDAEPEAPVEPAAEPVPAEPRDRWW